MLFSHRSWRKHTANQNIPPVWLWQPSTLTYILLLHERQVLMRVFHPPAMLCPVMPAILPLWEYCCRTWALLAAVASIAELLLMSPMAYTNQKPSPRYLFTKTEHVELYTLTPLRHYQEFKYTNQPLFKHLFGHHYFVQWWCIALPSRGCVTRGSVRQGGWGGEG